MVSEFKSFLKTVTGNEGGKCHYPTRLDVYGRGCIHDCAYCYAKALLYFRDMWNPNAPAVADPAKVARAIGKLMPGQIVRLGGMTDCFQAAEIRHRATYAAIERLNEQKVGYLIVTKSPLVADDRYIAIMDRSLAHIQISVTSTDAEIAGMYERAALPSLRIRAIEKLYGEGVDVTLRLSPCIPRFIDMERLERIRCDKILIEFLRVNTWIERWLPLDFSDYTLRQSGYRHLPLEKKIDFVSRISGFSQLSVCEDVTEHYDYWKYHVNHNPMDCCNLKTQNLSW